MTSSPLLRFALGDLRQNRTGTAVVAALLVLSALLMATGAMVLERSFGAVDRLFERAKPPHFLQMHSGDYDRDELERFAAEHPQIDSWLIEDMLGFEGTALAWERIGASGAREDGGDFSENLIDHLFVTQNEDFDFLLDDTGAAPRPVSGEVYLPVATHDRFGIRTGDEFAITTEAGVLPLRVAGFVRDAQMASSLSSATRFLVSETDFEALREAGGGDPEIIVEYRLADPASAADLQSAYESDAALPKNGQAVTFQLIRMINAFSGGLVAIALVFASLLLVAIAMLNLRFVIRGALEDDVREIGALRAIGIRGRTISRLYLAKYALLALAAGALGGLLAIPAAGLLTRGIRADYGEAPVTTATFAAPIASLCVVVLVVLAICASVLRACSRVEVVSALVHGSTLSERRTARRARRLARRVRRGDLASGGGVGLRLAIAELRAEGGQWLLIPAVFTLATLLVTLPTNLLSTLESPRFITYMGAPESDLRSDLRFTDGMDAVNEKLVAAMRDDERLTEVRAFERVLYETRAPEETAADPTAADAEGRWENLPVDVGEHAGADIELLRGEDPGPGQIALSVLNAEHYGVDVGDPLPLRTSGEMSTVEVSGVYQDVTSGGRTAKMVGGAGTGSGSTGYTVYAAVQGDADPVAIAEEYGERFPDAGVIPMREYMEQTLSQVTNALRGAAVLASAFGVGISALITVLFLKLRMTRQRREMGALGAIGFSRRELANGLRGRALVAVAIGTLLGALLAATAGEALVASFVSAAGIGIADLAFIPNPWLAYGAIPLLLIAAGALGAAAVTAPLRSRRGRATDGSTWLR